MLFTQANKFLAAFVFGNGLISGLAHEHGHHEHGHHDHGLLRNGERRQNVFGSVPPGQCKDGDPTYTVGGVTYACEADFNAKGGQCRTPDSTEEERAERAKAFQAWKEAKAKGGLKNGGRALGGCPGGAGCVDWDNTVITIPTYFHVIHDGATGRKFTFNGYAESDPSYIIDQIKVMNKGFRGLVSDYPANPNGRSYPRYSTSDSDTKIQFCLAGTTRSDDSTWYADKGSTHLNYKAALDVGGMETLNVYVNTANGYLGYAYFPTANDSNYDGVVILNQSMPRGGAGIYQEGDTLTHEVGHWLALEHTHASGCSGPGDYMDRAPPSANYQTQKATESTSTFNCPVNLDNCSGDNGRPNPIHNFMAYSQDNCMDEFTPGQKEQLQWAWEQYRHNQATSLNYGLAADGYSCTFGATSSPTTPAPTTSPTLPAPTTSPTTLAPTKKPTAKPTAPPTTPVPTKKPTAKPTAPPTNACLGKKDPCDSNNQCCSGKCTGPNGSKTCN